MLLVFIFYICVNSDIPNSLEMDGDGHSADDTTLFTTVSNLSGPAEYCEYCMALQMCHRNYCDRRTFTCIECRASFITREERDSHLLTHLDPQFIKICLICGNKFKNAWGYSNHCLEVHGFVEGSGKKCYKCNSCEKFFMSRSRLLQHEKSHSNVKEFCCEVCKKEFKYKKHFKLHMESHGIYLTKRDFHLMRMKKK